MAYPSTISALSNPQPTDRLNSPSHSSLHQAENTGINEIQTFVGTLSSVPGTLIYDVRSSNSNGGGHVQTANTGGTGQITYNKGDLLVAQSSSVLTKLAVGSDNQILAADSSQAVGVKWSNSQTTNVQSFIGVVGTSVVSNWIQPGTTATSRVLIQLWAGGASGAGGITSGSANSGGGGGGAGGYSEISISASILTSSVVVSIGAGGASVAAAANGNNGGNTTFGTYAIAFGGIKGSTSEAPGVGGFGLITGGSGGGNVSTPSPSVYGASGGGGGADNNAGGGNGGSVLSVPRAGGIGGSFSSVGGIGTSAGAGENTGGSGGGGGGGANGAGGSAGDGGAGGVPSGGGGGGGAGNGGGTSGKGGNGGAGKAIITTYL